MQAGRESQGGGAGVHGRPGRPAPPRVLGVGASVTWSLLRLSLGPRILGGSEFREPPLPLRVNAFRGSSADTGMRLAERAGVCFEPRKDSGPSLLGRD